jgi:DNA-binding transcriptional regulator YbjK
VDFLEQVVLGEVRRLMKFAGKYEEDFAKIVMGHSQQNAEADRHRMQKELYALNARFSEIDRLFNRMYEDNESGKIDDDRFARMSRQYTDEQNELTEKSKSLSAVLERDSGKAVTIDTFIKTVRQYTRAKKLTERMLSELIEKIEVHQSERADGVNMQRLTIHWNCIGSIELPDHIPAPEVSVHTRQGVATSYVPA